MSKWGQCNGSGMMIKEKIIHFSSPTTPMSQMEIFARLQSVVLDEDVPKQRLVHPYEVFHPGMHLPT